MAGFTRKDRPADLDAYIKNGRRTPMKVNATATYEASFASWYANLQPQWRKSDDGKFVAEGSGDWAIMLRPGANGFVNILAGVAGIAQVAKEEVLLYYVRDVRWTIREVLAAQRIHG